MMKDAFRCFKEMFEVNIVPTVVTYNALINGLCKVGKVVEAEEMIHRITSAGLSPDVITYNTLISGFAKIGNGVNCLKLYNDMKTCGIKPTLNTYHPLISVCYKDGMEIVEKLIEELSENKLIPDRVTYNELILRYSEQGNVEKSLALHQEMVCRGVPPDSMTYNSLIVGQLKDGKTQEAKELVNDMKTRGLIPKAVTYMTLIEGHCKLEDYFGAYNWYTEMFDNGFFPSVGICKELMAGLIKEGRWEEAGFILSEMSSVKGLNNWSPDDNEDLSAVAKMQ